jgi:hypothetical protein
MTAAQSTFQNLLTDTYMFDINDIQISVNAAINVAGSFKVQTELATRPLLNFKAKRIFKSNNIYKVLNFTNDNFKQGQYLVLDKVNVLYRVRQAVESKKINCRTGKTERSSISFYIDLRF